MSLRFPSPALNTALVLAARLGFSCSVTVNSLFGLIFPSGLACFSAARHFPFATCGRGLKHFAFPSAFPANPSNPALNPTGLTAVGLAPR
jgi:hypothetical protein